MNKIEECSNKNFEKIIDKAKVSCENNNISGFEHFTDVNKLSKRANNADVEIHELTHAIGTKNKLILSNNQVKARDYTPQILVNNGYSYIFKITGIIK